MRVLLAVLLLLTSCTRRPGYVPYEVMEAAVDQSCRRQCMLIENTCHAGKRYACPEEYVACIDTCPIVRPELVAPYLVQPTPTPRYYVDSNGMFYVLPPATPGSGCVSVGGKPCGVY